MIAVSGGFLNPSAQNARTQREVTGYATYAELLLDLQSRGHEAIVLGTAPDGSQIVAVKGGGNKLPPIFLSAGAHSTE